MFFIVNKTTHNITLGDLGLNLGPHQAIDLDKIMKRSKSDDSKHLRLAKKNGDIEIRRKDEPKSPKTPRMAKSSLDLDGMKKEIIGEMKELLKGQTGVSKEDLQALINAMPKSTETVIIRQEGENVRQDEEVEMDEETLSTINARAVNEIVKDSKMELVHYKEKQAENTILGNVDELEGLLG